PGRPGPEEGAARPGDLAGTGTVKERTRRRARSPATRSLQTTRVFLADGVAAPRVGGPGRARADGLVEGVVGPDVQGEGVLSNPVPGVAVDAVDGRIVRVGRVVVHDPDPVALVLGAVTLGDGVAGVRAVQHEAVAAVAVRVVVAEGTVRRGGDVEA